MLLRHALRMARAHLRDQRRTTRKGARRPLIITIDKHRVYRVYSEAAFDSSTRKQPSWAAPTGTPIVRVRLDGTFRYLRQSRKVRLVRRKARR